MSKLLVVDDEESICWGLSRLGESIGHEVRTASSAEEAFELADGDTPDVVVLDVRLPGMDGLSAIQHLHRRIGGSVPIIIITAYGDLRTAVEAIRNGAFDYIVKPFDLNQVQQVLVRALDSRRRATPAEAEVPGAVGGLVGKTPAMQDVFKRIALAAESDSCVLIFGESGTGKELAARAIHRYSRRSTGPFVPVNVASLSPTLVESELFGHVQGAFTGADTSRRGLLVQADGGVLFLDEVADIPLPTQVKLLRAVEQGEVLPVGLDTPVKTNFRVISATHRPLVQDVHAGRFRHDLYFRLCGFEIEMPPLRTRKDDIGRLAEHFLAHLETDPSRRRPHLSADALAELECRPWHGNVRELRNAIEHALILARGGSILPEHLPAPAFLSDPTTGTNPAASPQLEDEIAEGIRRWAIEKLSDPNAAAEVHNELLKLIEPSLLRVALDKHHGQYAPAARILGLHRTTLRKKMKDYGIGE